jgi:hypothetical protein
MILRLIDNLIEAVKKKEEIKADENIKQKSSVFPWLFALAPRIILYLLIAYRSERSKIEEDVWKSELISNNFRFFKIV